MPKSIRRSLTKKGGFVRDVSVQHFRIGKKNIRRSTKGGGKYCSEEVVLPLKSYDEEFLSNKKDIKSFTDACNNDYYGKGGYIITDGDSLECVYKVCNKYVTDKKNNVSIPKIIKLENKIKKAQNNLQSKQSSVGLKEASKAKLRRYYKEIKLFNTPTNRSSRNTPTIRSSRNTPTIRSSRNTPTIRSSRNNISISKDKGNETKCQKLEEEMKELQCKKIF
jgi:hypothetical protein